MGVILENRASASLSARFVDGRREIGKRTGLCCGCDRRCPTTGAMRNFRPLLVDLARTGADIEREVLIDEADVPMAEP